MLDDDCLTHESETIERSVTGTSRYGDGFVACLWLLLHIGTRNAMGLLAAHGLVGSITRIDAGAAIEAVVTLPAV